MKNLIYTVFTYLVLLVNSAYAQIPDSCNMASNLPEIPIGVFDSANNRFVCGGSKETTCTPNNKGTFTQKAESFSDSFNNYKKKLVDKIEICKTDIEKNKKISTEKPTNRSAETSLANLDLRLNSAISNIEKSTNNQHVFWSSNELIIPIIYFLIVLNILNILNFKFEMKNLLKKIKEKNNISESTLIPNNIKFESGNIINFVNDKIESRISSMQNVLVETIKTTLQGTSNFENKLEIERKNENEKENIDSNEKIMSKNIFQPNIHINSSENSLIANNFFDIQNICKVIFKLNPQKNITDAENTDAILMLEGLGIKNCLYINPVLSYVKTNGTYLCFSYLENWYAVPMRGITHFNIDTTKNLYPNVNINRRWNVNEIDNMKRFAQLEKMPPFGSDPAKFQLVKVGEVT